MSGKRMEPAGPALQKHHHHRRRHTRIWPLAVGAAVLAALVIGVWSLIAGYFILSPQPVLTLNGEKHEEISACSDYTDPGARAHRGRTDLSGNVEEQSDLDTRRPGDYTITYTVTYRGRTARATRTVTVRDTTAPVIELRGDAHSFAYLGADWKDKGVTATDDVDGDVTSSVTVSGTVDTSAAGDYTITYTVTDQAGNAATAERTVTVKKADKSSRIYLTFDDGPSIYTNDILDILDSYNVKATFFVVGKEGTNAEEALQRIVDEGHTLGMHSYSHKYKELYESMDSFTQDFARIRDSIYQATGVESVCYRFPGGSSNTISEIDMHDFIDYLDSQGVEYYDWNVSSGDGGSMKLSTDTLLENCTKDIDTRDTSIILLHDSAEKPTTVEALPDIIENILARPDTVILPITENTRPIHHIE